jgi:cysteinyl-tRNA synthetase
VYFLLRMILNKLEGNVEQLVESKIRKLVICMQNKSTIKENLHQISDEDLEFAYLLIEHYTKRINYYENMIQFAQILNDVHLIERNCQKSNYKIPKISRSKYIRFLKQNSFSFNRNLDVSQLLSHCTAYLNR